MWRLKIDKQTAPNAFSANCIRQLGSISEEVSKRNRFFDSHDMVELWDGIIKCWPAETPVESVIYCFPECSDHVQMDERFSLKAQLC